MVKLTKSPPNNRPNNTSNPIRQPNNAHEHWPLRRMGRESNDGISTGTETGCSDSRIARPTMRTLLLGATAQIKDPASKMNMAVRKPGLSEKYLYTLPHADLINARNLPLPSPILTGISGQLNRQIQQGIKRNVEFRRTRALPTSARDFRRACLRPRQLLRRRVHL